MRPADQYDQRKNLRIFVVLVQHFGFSYRTQLGLDVYRNVRSLRKETHHQTETRTMVHLFRYLPFRN